MGYQFFIFLHYWRILLGLVASGVELFVRNMAVLRLGQELLCTLLRKFLWLFNSHVVGSLLLSSRSVLSGGWSSKRRLWHPNVGYRMLIINVYSPFSALFTALMEQRLPFYTLITWSREILSLLPTSAIEVVLSIFSSCILVGNLNGWWLSRLIHWKFVIIVLIVVVNVFFIVFFDAELFVVVEVFIRRLPFHFISSILIIVVFSSSWIFTWVVLRFSIILLVLIFLMDNYLVLTSYCWSGLAFSLTCFITLLVVIICIFFIDNAGLTFLWKSCWQDLLVLSLPAERLRLMVLQLLLLLGDAGLLTILCIHLAALLRGILLLIAAATLLLVIFLAILWSWISSFGSLLIDYVALDAVWILLNRVLVSLMLI